MNINPFSILLTILGGLVLAGLLGWIKKPRLIVLVPRLFSHSRISDKGQIAEISVMNRGFKTEEGVELSLSPSLHYELVGSNNPDASLSSNKLLVPRIGSGDDCSVLLQVENGRFTRDEIVSCLSKETKASIATKLEDVPVTAQQRVWILMFIGVFALLALGFTKGVDYIVARTISPELSTPTEEPEADVDTQGWNIGSIYAKKDNVLFQGLVDKKFIIATGLSNVSGNTAKIPVKIENSLSAPVTVRIELISSEEQNPRHYSKRALSGAVLFPDDSIDRDLEIAVPADLTRRKIIIEFFVQSTDGETMSGRKILDLSES